MTRRPGTIVAILLLALAQPAAGVCVGDCDGGGTVTVEEIVTATADALAAAAGACPAADADGHDGVTVDEIMQAVAALLHGCPIDEPVAIYDRSAIARFVPFPDDVWTRDDSSSATGVRLELPQETRGVFRAFLRDMNRLDGFSPIGHFVVALSAAPDPATLPRTAAESLDASAAVGLFDVDADSPTFAQRVPFQLKVRDDTTPSGLRAHTLLIFPSIPLRPGGRYGLVMTRGVRSRDGRAFAPSPFMAAALAGAVPGESAVTGRVRALAAGVLDMLSSRVTPAIAAADVALVLRVTVRTTDDLPADMLAMRAEIRAAGMPAVSIDRIEPGLPSQSAVAAVVYGTFEAPDFRDGLFFRRDTGTGLPVRVRTQAVPFVLALPRAALNGPVPIVMYQHGSPGSAEGEVPREAAGSLARAGFAVGGFTDNLNREVGVGLPTRDEKQLAQVAAVFFALIEHKELPDYWLQANAEQIAFVQALRAMNTLDLLPLGHPDGVPELDTQKALGYVGISEGANHAPGFLPYAPEVSAAALVVGGERLAEVLLHQEADTFLTVLGPLYPRLDAADLWAAMGMFQSVFDRQDPHNHARFLYAEPLAIEGTLSKASILLIEGLEDSLVPNNATESLAFALGLPHLSPVQRAVPFLEVVDGPLRGNLGPQRTAAFYQYVPVGVAGIAPTPGCAVLNPPTSTEGHYCAQVAAEARRQRVEFFTSMVRDGVPTIVDPLSEPAGGAAALGPATAPVE